MAAEDPAQAFEPGAELGGRYRLERRIGAGGMASVWLAQDDELARSVAVKVLSDVFAGDQAYVARFRRESRVAAGFSHPNLIRVFDFSGEGERPYMVMEYVPGGTLAERIEATGEDLEAERLAVELLGALSHIHDAGVVHRDIKPANVLFDRDGRARLTDFGIAQPEDATRLTQTGNVVGTLRYMAPEVLEGQPADARSDLYSLGVVLAECAGDPPPPALAALIERLTARDPAQRPLTGAEALALLEGGQAEPTAATQALAGTGDPTDPTAPAPPPPPAPPPTAGAARPRELHLDGGRVLMALAAIALLVAFAVLAFGGDGGGGGSASGGGSAGDQAQEEGAADEEATQDQPPETTEETTSPEESPETTEEAPEEAATDEDGAPTSGELPEEASSEKPPKAEKAPTPEGKAKGLVD